jgi:transcriptional regulator with GAF, ATPase, and Fis domain
MTSHNGDRDPGESRESTLVETFVRLADTLVDDYDVIDLLTELSSKCVALFAVDTAGLLVDDGRGRLSVLASSSEDTRLLELFELQSNDGPCLECLRTSSPVTAENLEQETRWPRFVPRALASGFGAVHALPLRLRERTVGALNLFTVAPGELPSSDARAAQGLADVATISLLQERKARDQDALTSQLQHALRSRVVIEQAKGVLAAGLDIEMEDAFERLRKRSRDNRRRLVAVAEEVVNASSDEVLVSYSNRR